MSLGYIGKKIDESERKQIVLTGAPGTGKTYGVREYAAEMLGVNEDQLDDQERFQFVQFHASYNYVDFVEGLKPAMINGQQTFVRMDGIFKAFCRKAAEHEDKTYYFVIDEINRADLSSVFGELMFCLEESYRGEKGRVITQYHHLPTYRYIEETANNTETEQEVSAAEDPNSYREQLKEKLLHDIEIAGDARCYDNLKNNILQTINNFDDFKTGSADNVKVISGDVFAEGFYIPENVIIIGTMNDIDRNVETFDFALRRRFRWIDIDADESIDNILKARGLSDDLIAHAKALNGVIAREKSLGAAFKLGQSYFAKYKDGKYEDYFNAELRPILAEYMRGKKNSDTFIDDCRGAFTNKPKTGSEAGSEPVTVTDNE